MNDDEADRTAPPIPIFDFVARILELDAALQNAFLPVQDKEKGSIEADRDQLHNGLKAIDVFLDACFGDLPRGRHRLRRLAFALVDLNAGITDPLLVRTPREDQRQGRAGDPTRLWQARASIAVAIEALCRSGLSQEDAVNQIKRKHQWIGTVEGLQGRKSKAVTDILKSWSDRFRRGDAPPDALAVFEEGRKIMAAITDDSDRRRALVDLFLNNVRDGLRGED